MEKEVLYVVPMVDIIEVEVEKGFALSGVDDIPGNNESRRVKILKS